MIDNDDIFSNDFPDTPLVRWSKPDKFRFKCGDTIKFSDTYLHVYEVTSDYVTVHIRKKYATAKLMQFMDTYYDAVYIGPMIDWIDGSHLTFRRKS